ncbi:MAG: paraquat-inducible protein A [Pseudomonadota bacterium]
MASDAASSVSDARPIACPDCDLLTELPVLAPGQLARCPRCGHVLSVAYENPFSRALALAVAALAMLALALAFPFLSITASGISNGMTLIQTVSYLASYGANGIAFLVFMFVILVPVFMLLLILLLAGFLKAGRFHQRLLAPARWLFHLNGWAMVEVFAIGVIVSLVKLAAMAKVELGIAFWAYLAFSLLFLMAFSSLDRAAFWLAVERARYS